MAKIHGDKCDCGAELPWHLVELCEKEDAFSHTCTCRRWYERRTDNALILVGTRDNPCSVRRMWRDESEARR